MITIICSTNRKNSVSRLISHHYQTMLRSKNEESSILYLEDLPSDFISTSLYENTGKNEQFNQLSDKMLSVQKIVFIVPEYNGSFPGVLKAFIDGLQFPEAFADKKCALVGVSSGGQGAGLALSHLTDIFNYCGMNVLASKPKLSRIEENLTENNLSELYQDLLEEQIDKFILY